MLERNSDKNSTETTDEESYLLLSDLSGSIHCVRLSTMTYAFCTDSLGSGRKCLSLYRTPTLVTPPSKYERCSKIMDVCTIYIGSKCMEHQSRFSVVAVLDTGDVVVYVSDNHSNGILSTFVKISHRTLSRRPKKQLKLNRQFSNSADSSKKNSDTQFSSPMDDPSVYTLRRFSNLGGGIGVLCNGLRPMIVNNDTGLPSLLPISLPELPFSSSGYYCVTPASFVGGFYHGLCCLWVEFRSKAESDLSFPIVPLPPGAPPVAAQSNSIRNGVQSTQQAKSIEMSISSVLGMYRVVRGLITMPNSILTLKRNSVGCTVHRVEEILPKTDDKIQLSLLKNRTFVLSTSRSVDNDFCEDVLTEDKAIEDRAHYDRYFPSFKSYCEKDNALGPDPSEGKNMHTIVLVQNNYVVDKYDLPDNETVLGVEVLYFDIEIPNSIDILNAPPKTKKVIFVAACTSIDDGHGDDSQAEGRILFFSVDYALYEGHISNSGGCDVTAESKVSDTLNGDNNVTASMDEIGGSVEKPVVQAENTTVSLTVNSSFLDSISPKLKLLWTGPGPSTVVKQLGCKYVVATLGSVIYIYHYNTETSEFEQLSFYFAPVSF